MAFSSEALSLQKPVPEDLPRISDRISYLFIDRSKVYQDRTGVIAAGDSGESLRVPVGSLAVVLLGPGCSVTTAALNSMYRAGCSVMTVGAEGVTGVTVGRPLTDRASWVQAQATLWADVESRLEAARKLYELRYPENDWPEKMPLSMMRGLEGSYVKTLYRQLATQQNLGKWRRRFDGEDSVNRLLNMGNNILYGAALASVSALGLHPGLGFIHKGAQGALLFDLADLHKGKSVIPLSFMLHSSKDAEYKLRSELRIYLRKEKVIDQYVSVLCQLLEPFQKEGQDVLLSDHGKEVAAGYNHSGTEGVYLEEDA